MPEAQADRNLIIIYCKTYELSKCKLKNNLHFAQNSKMV